LGINSLGEFLEQLRQEKPEVVRLFRELREERGFD